MKYLPIILFMLVATGISGCVTPYDIPPDLLCASQPIPTTTAEIPPWEWDYSPLAIEGDFYNFAVGVCDAAWFTGNPYWTRIPCTGKENDPYGMVMAIKQPNVENDINYSSALWVRPSPEYCWSEGDLAPTKHQPYIKGKYDCIEVDSKDRFHAWVGCMKGNLSCDVVFKLTVYGEHTQTTHGEWKETYDGSVTEVVMDLSSLAGNCVMFDLEVESNNLDVEYANALWLNPEIIKAK